MPLKPVPFYDVREDSAELREVCERVLYLRDFNRPSWAERDRIRAVMNGGVGAVAALLGDRVTDPGVLLPVANEILSAGDRLAQKLGRRPDVKVDAPAHLNSERAVERAEKRARLVESLDEASKLPMMLPQLGRWIPGYGYAVVVCRQGRAYNGDPFPALEMRDPHETFIGEWGANQQPEDVAVVRLITEGRLRALFPDHPRLRAALDRTRGAQDTVVTWGGDRQGWANQRGGGIEVYEYLSAEGTWWVAPDLGVVLTFTPNLLRRPPFFAFKRFAFDRLVGQYDHAVGLLANMARLNLLLTIAVEDTVMAETNVVGEMESAVYNRGRHAVNIFSPGTSVAKMNNHVPFEAFSHMDRLERQLRIVASYPVTDDAQSPNSFVTGRGLQELTSAVDLQVREYHTVLANGLVELDALRLEWDERLYGQRQKTMEGSRQGAAFSETYHPATVVAGNYRTRRIYGAMAGFDEPTKIVTGLQLLQADVIDHDTFREQIDGLENHTRIKERIRDNKVESVFMEGLLALAQQGDQRAITVAIDMLPEGPIKDAAREVFLATQPQPEPGPEALMANPLEPPPDVQTMLARLTATNGRPTATVGAQTVV